MPKSIAKSFRATLQPSGMGLESRFAILPFDIAKVWQGIQVRRVKGEINGFAFQTALFPTARGHGFFVNKKMLAGAHARPGDKVTIRLEPDLAERKEVVPAELVKAMKGAGSLRKWFEKLPPGHRRWIAHHITDPKSAASRQKRAEEVAERLYLTMEGERDLPPILRAAFQRQPLAEAGWNAMTPVQRRNQLFILFGYRSPEAQQKRLNAILEDAVVRAKRGSGSEGRRGRSAARLDWDAEAPEM